MMTENVVVKRSGGNGPPSSSVLETSEPGVADALAAAVLGVFRNVQ
jgi:hypothetical protein